jgi:predicted NBD/HSP70 family sugar kinase
MSDAERSMRVQELVDQGDPRAENICRTIGTYFGYAIAHYAEIYDIRKVLLMGGVTSGLGSAVMISEAQRVLKEEFPPLAAVVRIHAPDERTKKYGHAVAAACLPALRNANGETL